MITRERIVKLVRYGAVSLIATTTSLTVLGLLVSTRATSPVTANVIATAIGTVPSFELNRRWVWRKTGQRSIWGEIAPFWVLSFTGLALSTAAVAAAAAWCSAAGLGGTMRTAVIEVANVAAFGSLWIVQYVVLDRVLFRPQRVNPDVLRDSSARSAPAHRSERFKGGMNESVRLGSIRGVRIGFHWSLLAVFGLLVVTLAGGQLRQSAPGHVAAAYAVAAVLAAALFFVCLLAHELAHAVVARRRHIEVEGIVLWLLGGVSKLKGEPSDPAGEFRIAVAGPVTSLALGAMFFVLSRVAGAGHPASLAAAVFGWLGWINGLLAVFNLLPAFPLDGGRVLRSLLWRRSDDKQRATATAARTGGAFGYGFIALGLFGFLATGGTFNGLWLALIGWFLVSASRSEAAMSTMADRLQRLRVGDVMTAEPLTVPAWVTLDNLIDEGLVKRGVSSFPVVDAGGAFSGLVTVTRIRRIPQHAWAATAAGSVAAPPGECVVCRPGDDLTPVARALLTSVDRRAVVLDEHDHVTGIVSPSDLDRVHTHAGAGVGAPA